jgi:hypothetical protein
MVYTELMAAVSAPLAASFELGATGARIGITLGLGVIAGLAFGIWRRRLREERDPLRSLAPPAGPLRLARELKARSTTD